MKNRIEGLLRNGKPVYSNDKTVNRYKVIKLCLEGLMVKDMADRLGVNRKTIFWHFQKIKLEFDLGRLSTAGKYNKEQFKQALIRQGFSLDIVFEGAKTGRFSLTQLPKGL